MLGGRCFLQRDTCVLSETQEFSDTTGVMTEDCFHASFVEPFLLCVWFVWADDGELPPYECLWAEQVTQTVGTEHRGWGRCRGGTAVGIVWGASPNACKLIL